MKTMSLGGGTARERPTSAPSMNTTAYGGTDRVTDNRAVKTNRTHDGGYGARTVNKFGALAEREHGGFEWTGSAFPLRIPTTWKTRASVAMSHVHIADVISLAVILLIVGLAWYFLGPIVG